MATLISATALFTLVLPFGIGGAAPSRPMPSLKDLVAQARALSNEINSLNEQYNGLRIQLNQAQTEARIAEDTYVRDLTELRAGNLAVGQLAAQSYMNGGLTTPLELLTTSTASTLIGRAAFVQVLQQENGDQVSQIAEGVAAAQRARASAEQQTRRAKHLAAEMAGKRRQAQGKINLLNSSVFKKAMAVFNQTGNYPTFNMPTANTIGAQALRWALTRRGDPYVWGAAGPSSFDCSGLVLWAYAKVGISLPHFTGDQWNMGVHVGRNQLQPGDLVFFYPDIGHVGLYIGNGLMVDAPDFGEDVQVQPVMWDVYVGAVRIVG
ncbi:MAG TPA: C40 family peptidase [Streptosporangiaceae bacterium]|nr:C40 family peptidase [Streptosporangiaceae bacterium]